MIDSIEEAMIVVQDEEIKFKNHIAHELFDPLNAFTEEGMNDVI